MWLCCLKAKQANSKFSGIIFRHVLSSAPPPQLFQVSPPSGPGASPGSGSSPKAVANPSAQRMNFPNAFFQAPRQLWEPKQSKPEGLGRLTTEVLRCPRCDVPLPYLRFHGAHGTTSHHCYPWDSAPGSSQALAGAGTHCKHSRAEGIPGTHGCRISLTSRARCPAQQQPRASAVSHQLLSSVTNIPWLIILERNLPLQCF